jgi:putative glycosyltransferase
MMVSVVTSLYCSAPYIREFCRRISMAVSGITPEYEIILVNDGSPDDSLQAALEICRAHPEVRVIDLSRNFGHHKALMTGLMHSRGQYVFLIDVDLEEEPELFTRFWEELMHAPEADVVYGIQGSRKGGLFERLSGRLFYWALNLLSSVHIPPNLITARLMTRRYVEALTQFREQEVFLAGLWAAAGFVQRPLVVNKLSGSPSTYSPRRKLAILINSVTSFSDRPLVMIFYLGLAITLVSAGFIAKLLIQKTWFRVGVEGWVSIVASLWLLGGITIFCIGVIGIYLSKVFIETKHRPYTTVRRIYEGGENP